MQHSEELSKICVDCQICCHYLTFIVTPSEKNVPKFCEFYKARGARVTRQENNTLVVMFTNICPYLHDKQGCMIYHRRPEICRKYDGRKDPFLMDRCKLPKPDYPADYTKEPWEEE